MPDAISTIALRPSIGLGPRRDLQALQTLPHLHPVRGEVGQNLRLDVERHHRAVVLRLQGRHEPPGQLQRLVLTVTVKRLEQVIELDHQGHRHGRFAQIDFGDLLRHVVFENTEIPSRDSRDEMTLVVENRHVHGHNIHVAVKGREIRGVLLFLLEF